MYKALVAQHDAIDRLFAMLVETKLDFFPSRSGQPWDALVEGNAAIQAYKTREDVGGPSPLMERLRSVAPGEMFNVPWQGGGTLRIETHPIREWAQSFTRWIFSNPAGLALPKNHEELTLLLWVFGVLVSGDLEKRINWLGREMAVITSGRVAQVPVQSLAGQTVRPLCTNHKPVVKRLDEGFVELTCPNCSYRATMSRQTHQELLEMIRIEEGVLNAALDIMKGPPKEPGNG